MPVEIINNGETFIVPNPDFHIGDRVTSKHTGLPSLGTILGVVHASIYSGRSTNEHPQWDNLYPGWEDLWVYYVNMSEPQKTCSFEEWMSTKEELSSDIDKARTIYEWVVLRADLIAYVEADLELFE